VEAASTAQPTSLQAGTGQVIPAPRLGEATNNSWSSHSLNQMKMAEGERNSLSRGDSSVLDTRPPIPLV